jgi:hypothetical protein
VRKNHYTLVLAIQDLDREPSTRLSHIDPFVLYPSFSQNTIEMSNNQSFKLFDTVELDSIQQMRYHHLLEMTD